jgi:hypothetical protein
MANRERGEFPLVIGEQRYTLRLTTNACAELEDISGGRTFDQVMIGIRRGSVKDIRLLLWAALREHHSDIATDDPASVKAIGKLIDEAGGLLAMAGSMRALVLMNQNEEKTEPNAAGEGEDGIPRTAGGAGVGSTSTH